MDHQVPVKFKTCKRYNEPGQAHELTFTCYQWLPLLTKDRTRRWLVEAIQRARIRHSFDFWAYVIMPEHVHLLIFPRHDEYSISKILTTIKWPVAKLAVDFVRRHAPEWVERLTDRQPSGRVAMRFWQRGGGYDRNMNRESTLFKVIEYIHENPVRRGLVERAEDWKWSSAAWYQGKKDVPLAMDDTLPAFRT